MVAPPRPVLLVGFLLSLLLAAAEVCYVSGKLCTNTGNGNGVSSHTVRAQLMSSKNQTQKEEIISHYHLTPTEESAWMDLLPRKLLGRGHPSPSRQEAEEFDWAVLYRTLRGSEGGPRTQGEEFLREVSLHDVRLDPESAYGKAQQTNLDYLLVLDVDRMLWSFRKTAGLDAPGTPYGGWEAPNMELRGHFVGHYMSATALMWASTHNDTLRSKMSSVVDALYACQKNMGNGYLSAFPTELFDRFEALKDVWAPYYTIHKIMAGLLDQYTLAGNDQALQMVVWMAEYFGNRVKNVIQNYSIERHWLSLNEETGGMNDVLYRLYGITGDKKHLILAHLFDKPCFLGLLAMQVDSLSGFHANTHIPVVVGAQMRYEITGDTLYKDIGASFMDFVNSSHSYATGGTSVSEFWSDPKRLADTLSTEDEESCTTYNMLKVSRHLFRWTKEMAYADYYERALTNGVLSIQRGREPGVMIYMLPQGPGQSKGRSYHGWGTQFDSFWCCYGTGIESFSKLGDSIYFEELGSNPGLYIIQFIPSSFNWKSGGIMLNQKVRPVNSWDPYVQVSLDIFPNQSTIQMSTLNLRIPFWTSLNGGKGTFNAEELSLPSPGSFLSITKKWSSNDSLALKLPISLRTEAIKDDRSEYGSIQAILFGPYLLAGLTDKDWDIDASNSSSLTDWVTPIPASSRSQLISLTQPSGSQTLVLSNSNYSLTMYQKPKAGTDQAVRATFRLIPQSPKRSRWSPRRDNTVGQYVMLEPSDLPGMVVVHQGPDNALAVSAGSGSNAVFRVVAGLDGSPDSVSLEAGNRKGCFVYSDGDSVKLACEEDGRNEVKGAGASFAMIGGLKQYHPISFAAKGARRNFLLEPLLSLRDESYTIYFNIGT